MSLTSSTDPVRPAISLQSYSPRVHLISGPAPLSEMLVAASGDLPKSLVNSSVFCDA